MSGGQKWSGRPRRRRRQISPPPTLRFPTQTWRRWHAAAAPIAARRVWPTAGPSASISARERFSRSRAAYPQHVDGGAAGLFDQRDVEIALLRVALDLGLIQRGEAGGFQ